MARLTLIAHWKLNDNVASATVLDAMGSHNGNYKDVGGNLNTNTGASIGKINGALDFDGTDEFVEVADHADFSPILTPFSISAWIYMHSTTNFEIVSKGVYNTDGEWYFETAGSSKLWFRIFDESVASCHIGRTSPAISGYANTWIHVVATYDGGTLSLGMKIYLSGVRVDDTTVENGTFVSMEDLAHAVWIGRYDSNYANGKIDNVMIFTEALSAAEVKRLYNDGHGTEIPAEGEESRTRGLALRDRYAA